MGGLLYRWGRYSNCTVLISNGSVLTPDKQEVEEVADAFEGVLVGIGTKSGSGDAVVAVAVGNTNAKSPFGNRVGTKLLNRIPLCCGSCCGATSTSTTGFGSICTCAVSWGCSRTWFKQLARCCRRRRFTEGSKPGKRPTSVAHSLKPARNLPMVAGSVEMAVCGRCRFCRYLTVISRMSAFSSLECLAGCNKEVDTR